MRVSNPGSWSTKSAWLLAAVALSACQQTPPIENPVDISSAVLGAPYYRQLTPTIRSQVEPITLVHATTFDEGQAALSNAEMSRLVAFLEQSGAGDGARIELDGPRLGGGYHDALTAARLAALKDALLGLGLASEVPEQPADLLTKPNGAIFIAVTQATVILPDCTVQQPQGTARPVDVYSCSTSATLGMMVADPLDLERGRAMGAADGENSALSIQRYRTDKIKELSSESTSSE